MEPKGSLEKGGLDDLELKAILTRYLQRNTFDDLLIEVSSLASERGLHFTFYQAT